MIESWLQGFPANEALQYPTRLCYAYFKATEESVFLSKRRSGVFNSLSWAFAGLLYADDNWCPSNWHHISSQRCYEALVLLLCFV